MLKSILKSLRNLSFAWVFSLAPITAGTEDFDLSFFDNSMEFADMTESAPEIETPRSAPLPPGINLNIIKTFINIFDLWQSSALVRSRHPLYLPTLDANYQNSFLVQWNLQFQKQTEMVYPFVNRLNLDFLKTDKALILIKPTLAAAGVDYSLFEEGISLFERMNVQERRGIFSTSIEIPLHKLFFVRLNTSIIGIQRNYGPENLETEGNAFFKKVEAVFEGALNNTTAFDAVNPQRLKASFAKIPYEIGFGDAKIQLGFVPVQNEKLILLCGVECLPPLSSLFNSSKLKPEPEIFDIMYEIERLNRTVRNPVLGFGGNWGLGCFFEGKVPLFEGRVDLFSKMSFDKILARETTRDIIIDGEVFPNVLNIDSTPGSIQHMLFGIHGHYNGWHSSLGYDYYHQGKEFLSFSSEVPDNKRGANLHKASQKECLQHSLFSSIEYEWKKKDKEWLSVGLDSSVVLKRENIGNHWTVGLKAKMVF
jgi:hypothetical protein